nr:DUF255 domain-containing protein [Clostridium felsineum]
MLANIQCNKLINEKSPYLLQHAHNPVNWFPWCDEAFSKAKSENKPIFLSIGYSTCHWCHSNLCPQTQPCKIKDFNILNPYRKFTSIISLSSALSQTI